MDGRCKTLDASADGYVRAEACIVMLITATELSSTLNRGNNTTTDVMLRSTYVNQDGRSSSLTAPNGPSQQQVQFPRMFVFKSKNYPNTCIVIHVTKSTFLNLIQKDSLFSLF